MVCNNTMTGVDSRFQSLIKQGSQLQGTFKAEQAIEARHITIIWTWINQALDLIEPAMPPEDPRVEALMSIKHAYSNVTCILPGDTSEHIRKILDALNTAHEYFTTWCKCDFSQVKPASRARASHGALAEAWLFSRDKLLGSLKGKENGRTKRTALLHSYGRMYFWVQSMVKLGDGNDTETLIAEHVLTLAGSLRAILELFLDISLLACDKIEEGPEKFFSFEKVARHKIAKSSLKLHEEHSHLSTDQVDMYTSPKTSVL